MKLSDIKCKNASPDPTKRITTLSDGYGLFLEIHPNKSKYWRFKYRYNNKQKSLALGVYPEISLAEARENREKAKKLIRNGIDPSQVKKEQKLQSQFNSENTFEVLARAWHKMMSNKWTERHARYTIRRLEADIFPQIGSLPIADIKTPQIILTLRKIEERGANELAHRMGNTCGQVFRYAKQMGLVENNPATDLKDALQPIKRGHFSAITSKELPEFLQTLNRNDARLYHQTRQAIHLLALTFVRTGELINAKWDEIDFEAKEWKIPAERMKMRRPHLVPLSEQSLTILRDLESVRGNREWIFPSIQNPQKPMSNNTILQALKRMGYGGQMTGHGFRSLAMTTIMEKLSYPFEIVDRQLAHAKKNKTIAAYDRAEFIDERRKMMDDWATYLDEVKVSKNVINAKFGR